MSRSSPAQKIKIGLFGGSFDPIHHGHLIVAEWLLNELELNSVYFVPVYKHAFSKKSEITPAQQRLEMVKLAVQDFENFEVSDFEISKKGISYTIDTVRFFKKKFPNARLFFFIGGDNLAEFHLWKDYQLLVELTTFVVYDRPGGQIPDHLPKEKFLFVKAPIIEISSTIIRQRCKAGKTVKSLIPLPVWQYIQQNHLYSA